MDLPRCARRVELELAAGPIAALEARPAGQASAAVLLVPGFTGSKEDFLPLLDPLTESGLRVLAVDQRGQCDSPGLADPAAYRLTDLGAEIRQLAALLEPAGPVHVLGHSFGGIAVREALLGADGFRPRSVTLMDCGPAGPAGTARERLELFFAVSETLTLDQIHRLEPVDQHPDAQVSAFLLRRWLANDHAALRAMAHMLMVEPDRTDALRDALAARAVPCLVVTGVDDDVWPASVQERTADRLGARFAALPGAGHSPNTQQPAALTKVLLDFWTD